MNPIREFLEASNLHGLVYISKAESNWGKVLWAVSVLVSFCLAAILIRNSFSDWSAHPVSSVISTHPIKNLKFPNVTVCPPKGTNTALNYDLTRLNNTFEPSQGDEISNATKAIFTGNGRIKYVNDMMKVVNPENLKHIYQGFQAMPTRLNQTGFKIKLSGPSGEISTPALNEYDHFLYTLEFPEDMDQLVGRTGKLVIELHMNTTTKKEHVVEFRVGPTTEYVPFEYTWLRAEDYCVEKGGHLASVTSNLETGAVFSNIPNLVEYTVDDLPWVWLGGRMNVSSNRWYWVNGKDWVYEDWRKKDDMNEDEWPNVCLMVWAEYYTSTGTWYPYSCDRTATFICEYQPDEIMEGSKTFTYDKDNLPKAPLYIWWKGRSPANVNLQSDDKNSGLLLKWRIEEEFPDLEMRSSRLSGHVQTPNLGGKYEEGLYQADRKAKFTLQLPANFDGVPQNGAFVINLQAETALAEGWIENVLYSAGPTFRYHSERKTFEEAEEACSEDRGHLASVRNWAELEEVKAFGIEGGVWLGGTSDSGDGNWTWIDGQDWDFAIWDDSYPTSGWKKTKVAIYESGALRNYFPGAMLPFICRPSETKIIGVANQTWRYEAKDLESSKVTVLWEYRFSSQDVLAGWKNPRKTGFDISWYAVDSQGKQMDDLESGKETWTVKNDMKQIYAEETQHFVSFVNIAERALQQEIDHEILLDDLMEYRASIQLGASTGDCMNGVVSNGKYVSQFIEIVNMTRDITVNNSVSNVSDLALLNGFELYSSFFYCPQNMRSDLVLQEFILDQKSPRALLQGIANVIDSGLIVNSVTMEHMRQFCQMLQTAFKMDLVFVLSKTLSNDDIRAMIKTEHPLLSLNSSNSRQQEFGTEESLMAELSSHPVHLTSKSGKSALSAFIPFCAYQKNMLLLGEYIDGLEFPVCNKFTPTVHKGQLCYTIDISSVLPNIGTEGKKDGGLTLLLDYNTERSVQTKKQKETRTNNDKIYLELEDALDEDDGEARIFINTLKPFDGYGGGSFSMHALKQISPTEKFLQLPDNVKSCKNDEKQHCKLTKYLEHKLRDSKCVPWEFLQTAIVSKVTKASMFTFTCFILRTPLHAHQKEETVMQSTKM